MRHAALIVCVALAGWSARTARASVLYASANTAPGPGDFENIHTINQAVGASSMLGSSGMVSPLDLTSDWRLGSFRLWACDSVNNRLFSINPDTGTGTVVGNFTTPTNNKMSTIAFDVVTGKLYGTTALDSLYEINPDTGASSFIGIVSASASGITALGFDLAGILYGVSSESDELVTIKTDTAVASAIGTIGVGYIGDLAVRPEDGAMFVVSNSETRSVYTLGPATGDPTLIGPYGGGINFMVGLAFGPVPEPATLALVALGGLGLMRRRRK